MKKIIVSFLCIVLCSIVLTPFYISNCLQVEAKSRPNFSLLLDSVDITNETAPYISPNERVMVPVRYMAERMGCEIEWIEKKRQVVLKNIYGSKLVFTAGKHTVSHDNEEKTIAADAVILNSRMYVPGTSLELLSLIIDWNSQKRIVSFYRSGLVTEEISKIHKMFQYSKVYGFHLYCSTDGSTDLDYANCDFFIDTDVGSSIICLIDTNNLEEDTLEAIKKVLAVYYPSEKETVLDFFTKAVKEKKDAFKEFKNSNLRITFNTGIDSKGLQLNIESLSLVYSD